MNELKIPMNGGLVTSRDPSDLNPGELVQAKGIYYKPGDTGRAHILPTRAVFNSTPIIGNGPIFGVAVCQFDSGGTDRILAYQGLGGPPITSSVVYSGTPGATGTLSTALITGLSASATRLSVCHFDDRWYIANGYDAIRVIGRDSTGSIRKAGMIAPTAAPIAYTSLSTTGAKTRASGSSVLSGTWTDAGSAWDTSDRTFARCELSALNATAAAIYYTFPSTAFTTGYVEVKWVLHTTRTSPAPGPQGGDGGRGDGSGPQGIGGGDATGVNAKMEIWYKKDGSTPSVGSDGTVTGGTLLGSWTTFDRHHMRSVRTSQAAISGLTNGTDNLTGLRIVIVFKYLSGTKLADARIYDISASNGIPTAAFTTTTGMYYAYTEVDSVNSLESPPSPSVFVTGTGINNVLLGLPSSTQGTGVKNSNTNFFRIYRTTDGGTEGESMGVICNDVAPEPTLTSFTDDFSVIDKDTQATPLLRMLSISSNREGETNYFLDEPPPNLKTLTSWEGSLVGTSISQPRSLYYSEAGYPESWPTINSIVKFPIPERDEIVNCVTVGDTLMIACTNAIITLTSLPRVLDGVFNAAAAVPMKGQPGCVGQYAITTYSVAGEPRAVWVSPYGIHETNGVNSRRLTNALNWAATVNAATLSTAVLQWNQKTLALKFAYDSDGGGTNDSFLLLHMAPEHQTENGPKITGPFTASINCLASSEVAGVYREYSGHVSDGKVYLEESTGAEAVTIETARIYGAGKLLRVTKGNLRHSDMPAETCSITWSSGDDANSEEQTIANTVALDLDKGTEFWINRSGEWHSFVLSYTGTTAGSFLDVRAQMSSTGKPGRIAT